MTYECFPKDLNEFFKFKFTSNFALIHVNIAYVQIQKKNCLNWTNNMKL
jgi:hypothetical protein